MIWLVCWKYLPSRCDAKQSRMLPSHSSTLMQVADEHSIDSADEGLYFLAAKDIFALLEEKKCGLKVSRLPLSSLAANPLLSAIVFTQHPAFQT